MLNGLSSITESDEVLVAANVFVKQMDGMEEDVKKGL